MKLNLKYFGMVAEALSKTEESLLFEEEQTVLSLKDFLELAYPKLKTIDYRVAVNQTIVGSDFKINGDCEIALLPPFAGG